MRRRKRKRTSDGLWHRFGAWLDKRWEKSHALDLARRVHYVARTLGEPRPRTSSSRRDWGWSVHAYEDATLLLESNETGLARIDGPDPISVRVHWLGELVFECNCDEIIQFNYGAAWIGAVDQIYRDLISKKRRAAAARFQDMEDI
ncbi:MAG TPA: hypothetical protein PKD09_10675 [Aggregatilinea sp.]|uniref:hypothetical protein n=1 Tax=Aggregatilinea sp. TaxID=2806333 RepID=UPI002BBD6264|nr:hypothetical protein [Aggregatilinea sp.]HML22107.1 hypothetical protein [Aggregatilinea sp.]